MGQSISIGLWTQSPENLINWGFVFGSRRKFRWDENSGKSRDCPVSGGNKKRLVLPRVAGCCFMSNCRNSLFYLKLPGRLTNTRFSILRSYRYQQVKHDTLSYTCWIEYSKSPWQPREPVFEVENYFFLVVAFDCLFSSHVNDFERMTTVEELVTNLLSFNGILLRDAE